MKKNECNLVQDLLPNYIENLTSEDTNKYITKHLLECMDCSKIYDELKKPSNDTVENKKFVNYTKKFNIRFNILKWIIIIFILIFLISIVRKIIIIENLNSKTAELNKSNYISTYYQYDENTITIIKSYNLNNKYYRILRNIDKNSGETISKIEEKYDGTKIELVTTDELENTNVENPENINNIMHIEPSSYYLYNDNFTDKLKNYIFCDVKKVDFNGIECYRFTNLYNYQINYDNIVYINNENGLPLRVYQQSNDGYNTIMEFTFEFNAVDEDVLDELLE